MLGLSSCNKMLIVRPDVVNFENKYSHKYPEPIIFDKVSYSIPIGTLYGKRVRSWGCYSFLKNIKH